MSLARMFSDLQRISLSQQDLDDLEHVQPFVLTTQELPKYSVTYAGRQQLDELGTYVFRSEANIAFAARPRRFGACTTVCADDARVAEVQRYVRGPATTG